MRIYLDDAATTAPAPEVISVMKDCLAFNYGNPSSTHFIGDVARHSIDRARESIAKYIGAEPEEIYFTSGGTESDNWALKSLAEQHPGGHIITTKIEHHAILNTCEWLEKHGIEVTYLDVDRYGIVSCADIEAAIRPNTFLISIMFANNEIGSIQPIAQIGEIAAAHNIVFHTDAVQAMRHLQINVKEMHIDMMSVSGHKFNGPKGVGFLYARNGVRLTPLIHGGSQEHGLRAGTYNTPGIVGMAIALDLPEYPLEEKRDYFIQKIMKEIPGAFLNGSYTRLPNNVNICFKGCQGEMILEMLNQYGIYASSGSACNSDSEEPSYVLKAIGLSDEDANASIRFTLPQNITYNELDYVVVILSDIIKRLTV